MCTPLQRRKSPVHIRRGSQPLQKLERICLRQCLELVYYIRVVIKAVLQGIKLFLNLDC